MGRLFFSSKLPICMGKVILHEPSAKDGTPSVNGSLGPPESTPSWSVQQLLQGSQSWQTNRPCCCSNRQHLRSTVMRPTNEYCNTITKVTRNIQGRMFMNLFFSRLSECSPAADVASELKSASSCSNEHYLCTVSAIYWWWYHEWNIGICIRNSVIFTNNNSEYSITNASW